MIIVYTLAAAAGLIFGLGLIVSGMTDPARILAFLDVKGHWNPSLLFVMCGAIAVAMPAFAYAWRHQHTPTGMAFQLPNRRPITLRLVAGAVIFGVGWGLSGWCPGPSIVGAAAGNLAALAFTAAMSAGWVLSNKLLAR